MKDDAISGLSLPRNDTVIKLPDGRLLGYRRFGADRGPVVIALHGTPGSRLKFSALDVDAQRLGLQVIAPDRWGYGLTTAPVQPSLGSFAHDMALLSDALNIDRFGIVGVSGGGPYAAAVAAKLGARVAALALVSPVGQIICPAGPPIMSRFHGFCFRALPRLPFLTGAVFHLFRSGLRYNPKLAMQMAMARAAPADKIIMNCDEVRTRLTKTFIEGLRPGVSGPIIDLELFGRAWDCSLQDISASSKVWIGAQDSNVPISAARALSQSIDGCELTELADEGHLWVAQNYDVILHWFKDVMTPDD